MNIPIELVVVFAAAVVGLQGWTLIELVSLKTSMAAMSQKLKDLPCGNCGEVEILHQ